MKKNKGKHTAPVQRVAETKAAEAAKPIEPPVLKNQAGEVITGTDEVPGPVPTAETPRDLVYQVEYVSQPTGQPAYQSVERQLFLDQVAIALFSRGFPLRNIWSQAEQLWTSRCGHLAAEARAKLIKPSANDAGAMKEGSK